MTKRLTALAFLLLGVACATRVPPPTTLKEGAIAPDKAWSNVLSRFVDGEGRIDFAGVAKSPSDLEVYVAYVARTSPASAPESFLAKEAKLAYYINAYNALALYNAVRMGIPPELDSIKTKFFYGTQLQLGGDYMSLYALENKVIRPMGEPRIHFTLNCMVRSCPRLPREPFTAETLERDLEREARQFFNESRNVEVDSDKKTVRFSEILRFYTEDFLKAAPSLIAYANKYREKNIPEDFQVTFIPYDWTLNKQ